MLVKSSSDTLGTVARRIVQVIQRTGPDGRRVHSQKDVQHFLPLLLFNLMPHLERDDPLFVAGRGLLLDIARQRRVEVKSDPEALSRAVVEHYEERPVNPRLKGEVERILREVVHTEGGLDLGRAAMRFLGMQSRPRPRSDAIDRPTLRGGHQVRVRALQSDRARRKDSA